MNLPTKFVPKPPPPARVYVVLSPRGERVRTVQRTYKHHAFRRVEHLDGEVTTESVFCEVFAGSGACEHGWSFAEDEMAQATPADEVPCG